MTHEEFDAFVAESVEELEKKQGKLQNEFGLGSHAGFLFDQAKGTLEFKDASGVVRVRAQVIPIGSQAFGCYRAPSSGGALFLAIREIAWAVSS